MSLKILMHPFSPDAAEEYLTPVHISVLRIGCDISKVLKSNSHRCHPGQRQRDDSPLREAILIETFFDFRYFYKILVTYSCDIVLWKGY